MGQGRQLLGQTAATEVEAPVEGEEGLQEMAADVVEDGVQEKAVASHRRFVEVVLDRQPEGGELLRDDLRCQSIGEGAQAALQRCDGAVRIQQDDARL